MIRCDYKVLQIHDRKLRQCKNHAKWKLSENYYCDVHHGMEAKEVGHNGVRLDGRSAKQAPISPATVRMLTDAEFVRLAEAHINYKGPGEVSRENLEYLFQCAVDRLRRKVTQFEPPGYDKVTPLI